MLQKLRETPKNDCCKDWWKTCVAQEVTLLGIADNTDFGNGEEQTWYTQEYQEHRFPESALVPLEPITNKPKYRIVVTNLPDNNNYIDYEYLEKNKACEDAKIDFVTKYGNRKVNVKEVIESIKNLNRDFHKETWIEWLVTKTGYKESSNSGPFVLTKDCDAKNIYILKSADNTLYKFQISMSSYMFTNLSKSEGLWHLNDYPCPMQSYLNYILLNSNVTIYEFTNEKDFSEWYYNERRK